MQNNRIKIVNQVKGIEIKNHRNKLKKHKKFKRLNQFKKINYEILKMYVNISYFFICFSL
jgi:hypothetical protein